MANIYSLNQGTPSSQTLYASAQPGDAHQLLQALWRSEELTHYLGTLDKQSARFKNIPIKGISEASHYAKGYSAMSLDAYFACAEFATSVSRTTQNAVGAWAFWADIDTGLDKTAAGKGYPNEEEANTALMEFCAKAGLPMPTLIVSSGSGVHVYWVFDAFLERDRWLSFAGKLKVLMKAFGLHADPSRTADIASVLRVPGTLNYKYHPPKPVTILSSKDEYIPLATMLDAIDSALLECGAETVTLVPTDKTEPAVSAPYADSNATEPPNLLHLESALKSLGPDCDDKTWKFYRLAPLAYLAREFPELTDTLRALAIRWSSGELRGEPSEKWKTPGGNGLSGAQIFDRVWQRFLTDNYQGKRVTVGTIFYHAKEAGWVYEPDQIGSAAGDGEGEK